MISWRKDHRPGCMQLGVLIVFVVIMAIATFFSFVISRNTNEPTYNVATGKRLMMDTFAESAGDWRTFSIEDVAAFDWNREREMLQGRVSIGQGYLTTTTKTQMFRHIMLEAAIKPVYLPDETTLSTGVICHADAEGNGYYFLVASTGRFSIQKGVVGEPDLISLVPWTAHDAVTVGENRLRAICAYRYLGLYINDVFVADVNDDTTFSGGRVGLVLAGGSTDDAASERAVQVEVAFDDVSITEVSRLTVR